jgi:hypothetical protein
VPVLAAIGPCASKGSGEQSFARALYPQLEPDWLLMADWNFYNWQGWYAAADTGAVLLCTPGATTWRCVRESRTEWHFEWQIGGGGR